MRCSIKVGTREGGRGMSLMFIVSSLVTRSSSLLWACPLCKDNIPSGMARGFFWSILLMIAVPAVVVGVIARAWWTAERKTRASSISCSAQVPPVVSGKQTDGDVPRE